MGIVQRRYNILADFMKVYNFFEETYNLETLNSYLPPHYFEYAQHHANFNFAASHRIGLWEDKGVLIGISMYEMSLGTAQLHAKDGYKHLLPDMVMWAENEISIEKDGRRTLDVQVTDMEDDKKQLLIDNGYSFSKKYDITIFRYENPFVERELPDGFKIISGRDVDWLKLKVCFYRGFNHGDKPPDNNTDAIFKLHNAPHSDPSLMTVIVAPNGEYACALDMWMDYRNKYAYLEPLATVPKYRRMGLATIALTEAMKKTVPLGARYCFGGGMQFYYDIGFEKVCDWEWWKKEW
jgi:GNAT superfamily N-acetyltransferase